MGEVVTRGERRHSQQRRYAPKTRTGCLTCKIRRVKCDEAKPNCRRCTSTGRKCDGYNQPNGAGELAKSFDTALTVGLNYDIGSDALERRTFDYFRCRTGPCVSGYFSDAVWDRLVLQVSHTDPTVRHAVNALGALHEERSLRGTSINGTTTGGQEMARVKNSFPVVQYSKALNGLQTLLKSENVSMDIVLMCVILCVHFESMREEFVPALMHMNNAIRILHESTTFDARKIEPSLVRTMMRLDLQGSMYLGMRIPGLPFYTASSDSTMPKVFHDLTHARDFVNTWTCRLFHFMRVDADDYKLRKANEVPLEIIAKSQDLIQMFTDIDRLLWDFMHKPTVKLSMREQHGLGILRSRVKLNRILAAGAVYSEASVYDRYLSDFEEIMSILCYIMESDNADRRLFSVSLDEGLLHPLFYTAIYCRDSRLRRRALEQMKKLPAKEGVWHVEAMTRTAQVYIEFEEEGCEKEWPLCSDIPEWRRIHSVGFDSWFILQPVPRVTVHMVTRPNGMDGEWVDIQQVIEWNDGSNRIQELDAAAVDKISEQFAPHLGFELKGHHWI